MVVQLVQSNSGWGYDRIVGALANLGYSLSDQTVGHILRRRSITPTTERRKNTTWKDFNRSHISVLAATDFFTAEVLTWRGLVTYYILFFIHLDTRRVSIAGITEHPDGVWMEQIGRNATSESWGFLQNYQISPTCNVRSTTAFRPTVNLMPALMLVWKPVIVLLTSYDPTGKLGNSNRPEGPETVERDTPASTFLTTIAAPGTAAPVWSETVPAIVAVVIWPKRN